MPKKKSFWESDEILDPSLGIRLQKVNTEFYLGRLAYECSRAGRVKDRNPIFYKQSVEQFEIFGLGSELLGEKYQNEKKRLQEETQKKIREVSKSINPSLKRSKLNPKLMNQVAEIEMEYITNLHRLLMVYLSPLFYTHTRTERI